MKCPFHFLPSLRTILKSSFLLRSPSQVVNLTPSLPHHLLPFIFFTKMMWSYFVATILCSLLLHSIQDSRFSPIEDSLGCGQQESSSFLPCCHSILSSCSCITRSLENVCLKVFSKFYEVYFFFYFLSWLYYFPIPCWAPGTNWILQMDYKRRNTHRRPLYSLGSKIWPFARRRLFFWEMSHTLQRERAAYQLS